MLGRPLSGREGVITPHGTEQVGIWARAETDECNVEQVQEKGQGSSWFRLQFWQIVKNAMVDNLRA